MKLLKHSRTMVLAVGMMALALTACGSNEETKKGTEEPTIAVEENEPTAAVEENEPTTAVETEDTNKGTEDTNKGTEDTNKGTEDTNKGTEDTNKGTENTNQGTENTTTAVETEDTTAAGEASSAATTITEAEAINLVKAEMGEDFSYIPADALEEKDGSQYYVIYVKMLLDAGNMTTVATYMVKTDGSELFDKDAVNYPGEYVRIEEGVEETLVISEDGSFVLTTITAEVNQVITGRYKCGITDSASVIELLLYPNKYVTNGEEEIVENVEGKAVIEGDKLTFSMESEDTIFTKK